MFDLIFNTFGLDIIFIVVVLAMVGSRWGLRRQQREFSEQLKQTIHPIARACR
jgi:hypothetical protein